MPVRPCVFLAVITRTRYNNIFSSAISSGYSYEIDDLTGLTVDYNVVQSNLQAGASFSTWKGWGADLHGLVATPAQLFVNPSGNDYHLSSTSPAIDAGTSTDAPSTDLGGNPRPSGKGYDIGAYEYQSGTNTIPTVTVTAPASATAGAPFSITVTAQTASNGTATGYTGTVHFTSSDGQAVLPANYTFTAADAGVHTFTGVALKTAGSQTVTATATATATISGTGIIAVSPAAAGALAVTAPASATAGVPFSGTVTARDPEWACNCIESAG